MPASEKSIEGLREESERTREDLAFTVDELRGRIGDTATALKTLISPAHIKREIKDYVRQERESLVESLTRKAQENPLQMAAIGAAVAYPTLGLLRSIPTPLWLIGGALFLTSKRGQQAAKQVKERADNVVQEGTERVSDLADSIQSDLQDRVAGARYGLEEVSDAVSSTVGSVTETVGSLTEKARGAFQGAKDAVAGGIGDAATVARAQVGSLGETADAKIRANTPSVNTTRSVLTDFINTNPLIVAGIGAAVGAFLAASIPPSDAENRLFGAGSNKLKDKARDVTAQGIEKAGELASEAAGVVAASAAREGLDASGFQEALNKVAGSVRAVADRGLDTAVGTTAHQSVEREQPKSERNSI